MMIFSRSGKCGSSTERREGMVKDISIIACRSGIEHVAVKIR